MDLGTNICITQDCELSVTIKKKQLCNKHYLQVQRHGYTFKTNREIRKIVPRKDYAEVVLTKGKVALIDLSDVDAVQKHQWYFSSGYAITNTPNNGRLYLHRFLLQPSNKQLVDHINRDKLDNRKNNLRICKSSDNNHNRALNNPNGFRGITWNKRKHKWASQISIGNKNKGLGYFTSKLDAARAYDEKALELYGRYARLNNA